MKVFHRLLCGCVLVMAPALFSGCIVSPHPAASAGHRARRIWDLHVALTDAFGCKNPTAIHKYDFGDGGEHLIELEDNAVLEYLDLF